MKPTHRTLLAPVMAMALLASQAFADRTDLKPPWNMYSKQTDIQVGRQAQAQAEQKLDLVHDTYLENYINTLGQRLARLSRDPDYPYSFHVVRDKNINAFALPGGPVYVNTGTIAAAENEAQLAGVMAHEISHIVFRHATSQASKAGFAQLGLGVLGGLLGGTAIGSLAQLGIGFGANTVFLKYSRSAESQADLSGTQIMYDAGYDPDQLARFFQKLESQDRGNAVQFLSDHPNPGNRVEAVRAEARKLGAAPQPGLGDQGSFEEARAIAVRFNNGGGGGRRQGGGSQYPSGGNQYPRGGQYPSSNLRTFDGGNFRIGYPDNWGVYGQGTSVVTIAPHDGIVQSGNGSAIARGAIVSDFEPETQMDPGRATDELVRQLQQANRGLRITSARQATRVGSRNGYTVTLSGRSPANGQNETDWLISAPLPDGSLWYTVFVAPESDFSNMRPSFERMLNSIQLR